MKVSVTMEHFVTIANIVDISCLRQIDQWKTVALTLWILLIILFKNNKLISRIKKCDQKCDYM